MRMYVENLHYSDGTQVVKTEAELASAYLILELQFLWANSQ